VAVQVVPAAAVGDTVKIPSGLALGVAPVKLTALVPVLLTLKLTVSGLPTVTELCATTPGLIFQMGTELATMMLIGVETKGPPPV
jgi:hypothetical protein